MTRRVDLPSGGYLMIDYAEALTVIDVNSGSFIGRGKGARLEDTITKTNLEAAEEVVNQLRLRDIGGIIVIDFIDMARARNRDAVLKTLRKSLDEDRTKTFTAEISKLGLVEMTRQNVTEGVREIMTRPCPTCDGEGVIKSEETIAIEFERQLREHRQEGAEEARGVPRADEPARQRAVFTGDGARCCTRSRRRPASASTSRAPRACRSTTSTITHGGLARGGRGARACRSARATRCSSTSSSRTCTTSTTRSPRSTATSSASTGGGPLRRARSASCASTDGRAHARPTRDAARTKTGDRRAGRGRRGRRRGRRAEATDGVESTLGAAAAEADGAVRAPRQSRRDTDSES